MVWEKKKRATKPKKEHDYYASRLAMWEGDMEHGTLQISLREQLSTLASSQVSLRDRGCWRTAYLGLHKIRLNKIKLSVL